MKHLIVQNLDDEQKKIIKFAKDRASEKSASKAVFSSLVELKNLSQEHEKLKDKFDKMESDYKNLRSNIYTLFSTLDKLREVAEDSTVEIF